MNLRRAFTTTCLSLALGLMTLGGTAIAGDEEKPDSPEKVEGAKTITAAEAKKLFDEGVAFVDTRKDKDWEAGRIPDAIHIELKKKFNKESLGKEVKPDEKVVFYCNGVKCLRSSKSAKMAVEWGYKHVYYFRLGFPEWKKAGYPTE